MSTTELIEVKQPSTSQGGVSRGGGARGWVIAGLTVGNDNLGAAEQVPKLFSRLDIYWGVRHGDF